MHQARGHLPEAEDLAKMLVLDRPETVNNLQHVVSALRPPLAHHPLACFAHLRLAPKIIEPQYDLRVPMVCGAILPFVLLTFFVLHRMLLQIDASLCAGFGAGIASSGAGRE